MTEATGRAIETVRHCLRGSLTATAKRRNYSLLQESYSKWAAREILVRLIKEKETPPLVVIEQFRDKMDEYSCRNLNTSYMFSVAKDTAEWIIDLLIT